MSELSPPTAAPALTGGPAALLARYWPGALIAAVILVLGGAWFWNAFHDRGYAPRQPIAFSHKQHVGDLHLECRFCHFNAERGKHAGVPPMSVCMGCHNVIAAEKPEIAKLAGIATTGSYTDADGVVHEGGVVHWNRVHKLPDHVYFNHAAHVAADVACQTCHGPVEEMVVVRQHADLTMGWCLDCHRRTNYVGGPGSDPKDPTTWRVGSADYAAQRDRDAADPVVAFRERALKGAKPVEEPPAAATVDRLADFLRRNPGFAAKVKDLPAWRRGDLPDSHRLMNAPTDCGTCHQ